MNKKVLLSITFLLVLAISLPMYALAAEGERPLATVDLSMELSDDYFVFIYDEEQPWLVKFINDPSCIDGYLYVKDNRTNTIKLITTEEVRFIRETPNAFFYVTEDDRIICMDYLGEVIQTVYKATRGGITSCERLENWFCLVEGDNIIRLNLNTLQADVILQQKGIAQAFLHSGSQAIWCDNKDQFYLLDCNSRGSTPISDSELDALTSLELPVETLAVADDISPYAFSTTQEDFPFYNFPHGSSYFTKNGQPCTDHNIEGIHLSGTCNCRRYAGGSQCYGFAYYASDRYAHISGTETSRPGVASGDWRSKATFTYDGQIRSYCASLTKGAYIRFSRNSPNDEGNHSVVYVSSNSSGITVYDCNVDNACGITLRTITYSDLRSRYPYICGCFSHTYAGTATSISNSHHRVHCTGSGCGAYIIQPHFYNFEYGNACTVCGYIGSAYSINQDTTDDMIQRVGTQLSLTE